MNAGGKGAAGGFTLLEVVVALLVLEIAVVGLVGTLVLASATLTRAETLERVVATAEGVLDSLAGDASVRADSSVSAGSTVTWLVDDSGRVRVRATDATGSPILDLESVLPVR
jgi:type II secretory pathway pseudopilin PulG